MNTTRLPSRRDLPTILPLGRWRCRLGSFSGRCQIQATSMGPCRIANHTGTLRERERDRVMPCHSFSSPEQPQTASSAQQTGRGRP